jgi:phosphoglycolate phosphatase-like HAD superfamily hydrolase
MPSIEQHVEQPNLSDVARHGAEQLAARIEAQMGRKVEAAEIIAECRSYLETGEPAHAEPEAQALAVAGLKLALSELAERKHATAPGSPERAGLERQWNAILSGHFAHIITGVAEGQEVNLGSIAEAISQRAA